MPNRLLVLFIWPVLALAAPATVLGAAHAPSVASDTLLRTELGYRYSSAGQYGGRAAPYSLQKPGASFDLVLRRMRDQRHLLLDLDYLNPDDYYGDLRLDEQGLVRIEAVAEGLYHNLAHFPFAAPARPPAYDPSLAPGQHTPENASVLFTDAAPGASYYRRVEGQSVSFRGKLRGLPAHLNLSYWRLNRHGREQLRFLDEGAGSGPPGSASACIQCHLRSRSRAVEGVTEEVRAGFDAHLGPLDLIFSQLLRQFHERQGIPRDDFGQCSTAAGPPQRLAGSWQHDEHPDAQLLSSTLQVHTSLSGGLVGAASVTAGSRENRSRLSDVRPVAAKSRFTKSAGDLSYTPTPHWTLVFQYRLLDMNSDNPSSMESDSQGGGAFAVRPAMDLTRATYKARISWRPWRGTTLQGLFDRREIHRSHTLAAAPPGADPDLLWDLPRQETIDRYRLSLLARPFGDGRLRLRAWGQILQTADPAYGTSSSLGQEGFTSLSWTPGARFGLTVSLSAKRGDNADHQLSLDTDTNGTLGIALRRQQQRDNLSGTLWARPLRGVSCSLTCGYLRTRVVQDLVFGNVTSADPLFDYAIVDRHVAYSQQVQSASLLLTWQLSSQLRLRSEGRLVRSLASFSPDFAPRSLDFGTFTATVDPSGLGTLSRLDTRQSGLSAGIDWRADRHWSCSASYTWDRYDDRQNGYLNGRAQTVSLSVARTW